MKFKDLNDDARNKIITNMLAYTEKEQLTIDLLVLLKFLEKSPIEYDKDGNIIGNLKGAA